MRFSDKLQALMIQSGDTQESLGKVLGVAHTTVGRWLGGVRPRTRAIAKAAEHFGVSFEILQDDAASLPSLPTPEFNSSSLDKSSPLPASQLAKKWHKLPKESRLKIADQIVDHIAKSIGE